MKLGISSYSLYQNIKSGKMNILDVIEWVAKEGAEHVEMVPLGFTLDGNPELVEQIKDKAQSVGIEISNYAIGGNFLTETDEAYEAEIARIKREVDIAHQLGVKLMRHDVAWKPIPETSIENFERDLPRLVKACQIIADHASSYGITTSVENHGYYVQASDRVQRLVQAVGRPNYKTTLDVGNFMCADENSVVAVKKNLPFASMVHLKDFYLRSFPYQPGAGWFPTAGGNYLRGAIVGHGDINMVEVIRAVKDSGYDGYISIEFEGIEECEFGARAGFENARKIWDLV